MRLILGETLLIGLVLSVLHADTVVQEVSDGIRVNPFKMYWVWGNIIG